MENEKNPVNNSDKASSTGVKTWSLKPTWNNDSEPNFRNDKKGSTVGEIIFSAVILITIVAIVGSLLALTNYYTSDIIKENEYNATQIALETIFPQADEFDDVFDELDDTSNIPGVYAIYKVYNSEELIGYCTSINTTGFNSQGIDMIVGSDTLNKVVMIKILDNNETPGIGTDVLSESEGFIGQFEGLARPIEFSTAITAVSGATVTSEGVRSGVDTALKAVDVVRVTLDMGESNE